MHELTDVSTKEASYLIIAFAQRFSLSIVAKNDLLTMIKLLRPSSHNLPKSFSKMEAEYLNIKESIKEEKFCSSCKKSIAKDENCKDPNCIEKTNSLRSSMRENFLQYVDMRFQISCVVQIFYQEIVRYRQKENTNLDFKDNNYYKSICKDLNLYMFTDGVPVTKSPSTSVWPVFCSLIELPPKLRDSRQNKIIFGVWYGHDKPNSNQLFKTFTQEIKMLKETGISINIDGVEKQFSFNFYGFNADLPAKAMTLNMVSHSGYLSCPYCLIQGIYFLFFMILFLCLSLFFIKR